MFVNPNFQLLKLIIIIYQVGTLAGNLIMKHDNPDFASDIFVLLETTACTLNIGSY